MDRLEAQQLASGGGVVPSRKDLEVLSMRPGDTVRFAGEAGAHLTLNETPCPETIFHVITVRIGGVYSNRVRCHTCHRALTSYGSRIFDPLVKELLNLRDESGATAGVKASYSYAHGNATRLIEISTKWFYNVDMAYEFFSGITEQAAVSAFYRHDTTDTLNSVTIEFCQKQIGDWHIEKQRIFVLPQGEKIGGDYRRRVAPKLATLMEKLKAEGLFVAQRK